MRCNVRTYKWLLLFVLTCCQLTFSLKLSASESLIYPKVTVSQLKDSVENRQYELYIKLPDSYEEQPQKQYPVIYFTDGLWHIELMSSITMFMMQDVILVGVSWQTDIDANLKKEVGDYYSRFRDYSVRPVTDEKKQAKYQFGQASKHLRFITEDVFSYVESTYQTDKANRSYFGFSMGGLFGSYALMAKPQAFKNYLLGSPSIWKNAPHLFSAANNSQKQLQPDVNVFISIGELEQDLEKHVVDFVQSLKSKQYPHISNVKYTQIKDAGHSDSSPMFAVQSIKWLAKLHSNGNEEK